MRAFYFRLTNLRLQNYGTQASKIRAPIMHV